MTDRPVRSIAEDLGSGTVGLRVLATKYAIDVGSGHAERQLRHLWSRCLASVDEESSPRRLLAADSTLPLTRELLFRLTHTINEQAIQDLAGHAVMLHAGGLSWHGRVVGLVASSGTGKTTAVQRLASHGLGYVTDETLAIRPDGSVIPFPKPLALIDEPQHPDVKTHWSPDELDLATCESALTAGPLVLLDRRTDSVTSTIEPLGLLSGLRELIPHTSALPALSRPLLTLAETVVAAGGVYRLTYNEIAEAAFLVTDLLQAGTSTVGPQEVAAARCVLIDDLHPGAGTSVVDAIGVGDEILILQDQRQVHLSALGALVWRGHDRPNEELVHQAQAVFGSHPDMATIVSDARASFVDQGLLQTQPQNDSPRRGF